MLDSQHVTVEVNTIFEQLNSVLSHIDPAKLNETLGAVSTAFGDRGETFGRSLTDLNSFLAKFEPSLPQLSGDLQGPSRCRQRVCRRSPDCSASSEMPPESVSTLVDEQSSLDRFLVSSIGLADIGSDVLGTNTNRSRT